MKKLLLILIACFMTSCLVNKTKDIDTSMFTEDPGKEELVKLSGLFKEYRLVQLETNVSCLLGGRTGCKVVKFKSSYYVQSQDAIYHFDSNGKYVQCLDKKGVGPDDYISIFDFDVVSHEGVNELWVSVPGSIKVYDAETFDFKRNVVGVQYAHQIEFVNDSTIMAVTPEDTIMKILRDNGTIRKSFMKKDMSVSVYKKQQFFRYDEKVMYQLDDTQTCIVYDINKDSLYFQDVLYSEDRLLTLDNCQDYYERYGYELQGKKMMENFTCLTTVRSHDDNVFFVKSFPDGKKELLADIDGKYLFMIYAGGDVKVQNDLFDSTSLLFLSTMTACKSDDSFLFLIPVSMLKLEGLEEDDNFWLLEGVC